MPEFRPESTIWQVLQDCPDGRRFLFDHGYDVGEGFVDVLSQYQSLRDAARGGRLRDLRGLIDELSSACGPEAAAGGLGQSPVADPGVDQKNGSDQATVHPRAAGVAQVEAGKASDEESSSPALRASGDRAAHAITVVGLFADREDAERAIANLIQADFSPEYIGYLEPTDIRQLKNPAEGAAKGIATGAASGAVLGALLAAVAVGLVPGLGEVLVAGALVPVVMGAVLGGSTGAVAGGLLGAEASSEDELYFMEEIQAGRILVCVEVDDQTAEEKAAEVLRRSHALEVDSLGTARLHARLRHPQLDRSNDAG
jgi:hypothetical protein